MPRFIHSKLFHWIIRLFAVTWLIKRILGRFPIKRKLPNGTEYRIKSPESFSIAREIFADRTYEPLLNKITIDSFIDLGCNTGYIACLLAEYYQNQSIHGLMIDANPHMVKEAEWHVKRNNLNNCRTLWGLIGPDDSKAQAEFFLAEFTISSSARPFDRAYPIPIRGVEKISTPVINLEDIISQYFDNRPVDFLKIDIEGSEKEFLNGDIHYLKQVDWIAIEWHKWVIDLQEVISKFESIGFTIDGLLKEDTICGVALFENKDI